MQALYAQLAVTLTPSNYNGSHISCFGSRDGSITANPTGGTPPYTYLWSNQQMGQTITGLAAGYYRLQVKDNVGAIVYAEITLTEPENLTIENIPYIYSNSYNISCWSCSNGIIDIYVDNGTPPYSFLWDDGNTNQSRTNLSPGTHYVTATDANGCNINSEQVYLTEPERSDWTISGNSGSNPSTNFIGTVDNKDLVFKTNNAERLKIKGNGDVKINGTLNVMDSITLNNNRQIGYRAAQGNDPEIMSFGKAPIILPPAITMCTDPNLTPTVYQFNGIIQSYGTATHNGVSNLNAMNIGFDGANAIIDAAGISPYPYGNNLLLNYYCGHDVIVGKSTSGDLIANHNMIIWGNVGIGVDPITAPVQSTPYKLIVAGKMGANEIWTSLGNPWPDYVFKKDYELFSLEKLEEYISKYKHLPGMPSAKEVAENDKINLGEMQTKQLEKIEELFLYVIELKKEIEALKKDNNLIKSFHQKK